MKLDKQETILAWFALLLEQENYNKGSQTWFKCERLIRKMEKELGMSDRPLLFKRKDD